MFAKAMREMQRGEDSAVSEYHPGPKLRKLKLRSVLREVWELAMVGEGPQVWLGNFVRASPF